MLVKIRFSQLYSCLLSENSWDDITRNGSLDARDRRVRVILRFTWTVVNVAVAVRFPEKMKIFSWLSCVLVAVTAVVAEDVRIPPTELQIETTFKPDSCPYQAKQKDYIHVHYVSRFGGPQCLFN